MEFSKGGGGGGGGGSPPSLSPLLILGTKYSALVHDDSLAIEACHKPIIVTSGFSHL